MSVEPLRSVRDHLSEVVDRVEKQHERVTITRKGRVIAVLISSEDLAELEETLSVLAHPEALADIREADARRYGGADADGWLLAREEQGTFSTSAPCKYPYEAHRSRDAGSQRGQGIRG